MTKWEKTTLENGIVAFNLIYKGEPLGVELYHDPTSGRYHYGMYYTELASRTEKGAKKEAFEVAHKTVLRTYLDFAAAAVELEK